jgi:hypothetical protein
MDTPLNQQVSALMDRYAKEKAQRERRLAGTPQSDARRVREMVLSELSGLSSKISDAVGEFNDLGADTGMEIEIRADPAPHYAVAVYRLTLKSVFTAQFELIISVDADGRMIGFLSSADSSETRPLKRLPISQVMASDISQMLITLVESELDCAA